MRRIVFIPMFAAAALLAATAPAAYGQRERYRDREEYSRIDTTVAFSRNGTVELELGSGEIIVNGWARDQVRVRATSERAPLRFDVSSSLLSLGLRSGSRSDETRFEVTVPAGVRVRANSASGDIRITGTQGEVAAQAQSGDIVVEDASSHVEINAFSGDIEATRVAGDVRITALSGDVKVSNVSGEVEAKTVSGQVDIRDSRAKVVRANSTSGDITYDGVIDPAGRYELQTHSGDVELTVPADVGAELTVSTYSGGIESDFPLTLEPGPHGKTFAFRLGKGGARISAESFSGDINIRSRGGRSGRDNDR